MTASRPTVVADASAIVALLSEATDDAEWAVETVLAAAAVAPRLLPFEVGHALRAIQRAGKLDTTSATLAHLELQSYQIQLWPHAPLAKRAWELRDNLSYYDACYVALAELLDAPLVTLDRRLARAPGPRCVVLTPPE